MAHGVDSVISTIKAELGKRTGGLDNERIKNIVKFQISEGLSTGVISEKEAKEVKKFFDNDMREALVRKEKFNHQKERVFKNSLVWSADKHVRKALDDTELTYNDLIEAAEFAGDDLAINKSKLTKAEKKAGKEGAVTSSELHNIQNFLNARIKAKGGTKELSKNDVLNIMSEIGVSDGTFNYSITGAFRATALCCILPSLIYGGIKYGNDEAGANNYLLGRKNEKAYGAQTGSAEGSVTNELEAKMRKFDVEY